MRPDERERMHRFCALMEKGREKIVAVFSNRSKNSTKWLGTTAATARGQARNHDVMDV
jgi:hypothetical protein